MTITKPIDLIVAEAMHDYARRMQNARAILSAMQDASALRIGGHKGTGSVASEAKRIGIDLNVELARTLLCQISHNAKIADVLKALAACGAPDTLELLGEGLKAVEEAQ